MAGDNIISIEKAGESLVRPANMIKSCFLELSVINTWSVVNRVTIVQGDEEKCGQEPTRINSLSTWLSYLKTFT